MMWIGIITVCVLAFGIVLLVLVEINITRLVRCLHRDHPGVWQSIGSPSAIARVYLQLGRTYLKKGDYCQAIQSFEQASNIDALAGLEETYIALGIPQKFVEFCRSHKEQYPDTQLYLAQRSMPEL